MIKKHSRDLNKLKVLVQPVAVKYGVKAVYIFGSYARNEATDSSDFDFYIEKGELRNLFQLAGFRLELQNILQKPVDVVTTGIKDSKLLAEIEKDKVLIYEAS